MDGLIFCLSTITVAHMLCVKSACKCKETEYRKGNEATVGWTYRHTKTSYKLVNDVRRDSWGYSHRWLNFYLH